jgi:hypothetical protein
MSHHYSGPDFGFPQGDARLDLTDLYAFPKPGDADKSILIMNVHPSAVVDPPGPTTAEPFSTEALYEFRIDTDGDAVADITYSVRFSSSEDGSQTATLRRIDGAQAADTGNGGQIIVEAAPVFAHSLEHSGGYTPVEAKRVAETLLPDMLSYDPTRPASFPGNGRTLTDDAADAFLAVLTNGMVTGDKVGAHSDLLAEFPYLGPPHNT